MPSSNVAIITHPTFRTLIDLIPSVLPKNLKSLVTTFYLT